MWEQIRKEDMADPVETPDTESDLVTRSLSNLLPMDMSMAERIFREAVGVMNRLGIVFYLEEGTCLGAIRESRIIPWDDDIDFGSLLGLNGLKERHVDTVVSAFRDQGFLVQVTRREPYFMSVNLVKSSIRIDWHPSWVVEGGVFHYPGVRFPVRLFTDLKQIDFLGEKVLVPNPPEEFLRLKYGPDWIVPKTDGYGNDVVRQIPETSLPGRKGKVMQKLTAFLSPGKMCGIRILDIEGIPVHNADVVVVGVNHSKTGKDGYARFYLPADGFYALVIRFNGFEEVLYEEVMGFGKSYVYRPHPSSTVERYFVLNEENR